jgi:hypothetical protein
MAVTACTIHKEAVSADQSQVYFIRQADIKTTEIDALGHIYVLDVNDRISKYDSLGIMKYHMVNNLLGHVHSFDVGNPFKTMVFFRDQQTIVMYDKTLSEIQRIRLIDWNLQDVTAACLSPDNAIWLFDGKKKVLAKMNSDGQVIVASDPFDIMQPATPRPDYIYDADHFLLLKEPGYPLSLFNDFAHFIKPLGEIGENFSITENYIIYPSGTHISLFDLTGQSGLISIPFDQNIDHYKVVLYKSKFYLADEKGIFVRNKLQN